MNSKPPSPRVLKTRQSLIEAAGKQLLLKGYVGATTRAIAETAGVSELTLFRHFSSKKELFSALFNTYSPKSSIQIALREQLTGNLRHDLILICTQSFSQMIKYRAGILITLSEAEALEELREIVAAMPRQGRMALTAYMRMKMDQGQLQKRDPALSAQALIGMFFGYIITQSMLREPLREPQEIVPVFIDIFLQGMLPHSEHETVP